MRTWVGLFMLGACSFTPPTGGAELPDAGPPAEGIDAPPDDPTAWLHPWQRRKAIKLLATQIEAPIPDDALLEFPVLVSLDDKQIAATADPSGSDIVFTGSDKLTPFATEIERFDPDGGELVAWVKVPRLSASTDTTIYLYYDHAKPPPRDPAPEAVWSADYLAVLHLSQDPGTGNLREILDATSNNNDGTAVQMETSNRIDAKIGRGFDLDGIAERVDFAAMDLGDNFTVSLWAKLDPASTNLQTLFANTISGPDRDGIKWFVNNFSTSNHRILVETGRGDGGTGEIAQTAAGAMPVDVFTHLAITVDRVGGIARIFRNGVDVTEDDTIAENFAANSDWELGRMEDGLPFNGELDEVQITTVRRPAEWLVTSVNNQGTPGSFYEVGDEELAPPQP
jgi:MSHA biogenesis protein MshQ